MNRQRPSSQAGHPLPAHQQRTGTPPERTIVSESFVSSPEDAPLNKSLPPRSVHFRQSFSQRRASAPHIAHSRSVLKQTRNPSPYVSPTGSFAIICDRPQAPDPLIPSPAARPRHNQKPRNDIEEGIEDLNVPEQFFDEDGLENLFWRLPAQARLTKSQLLSVHCSRDVCLENILRSGLTTTETQMETSI
jgi:hypothetical protein